MSAFMQVNTRIHGGPAGWCEVMEGLVQRNVRTLRGGGIPRLADVKLRYVNDHTWRDVPAALEERRADAGTLAAWAAAEAIVSGHGAAIAYEDGVPVVALGSGTAAGGIRVRDPSKRFGRQGAPGLIGAIPGKGRDGVIQEHMRVTIDDPYALVVREVGSAIARHNARLIRQGWDIPPLYESGIIYKMEGSPELWLDAPAIVAQGNDDCEGLSAYRAGELIAREGLESDVWTRLVQNPNSFGGSGGRTFHAVTRVRKGGQDYFDDPSARLHMEVPEWYVQWAHERRAKGLTLDWPPQPASGSRTRAAGRMKQLPGYTPI